MAYDVVDLVSFHIQVIFFRGLDLVISVSATDLDSDAVITVFLIQKSIER
jgi:hypothetical protein